MTEINYLYEVQNLEFLYKDQYNKQVFYSSPSDDWEALRKKIEKHNSINPILKSKVKDGYLVKFNGNKHLFKSRTKYDILYFIHKHVNEKNKKSYINLHISDMQQCNKKELDKILIENI